MNTAFDNLLDDITGKNDEQTISMAALPSYAHVASAYEPDSGFFDTAISIAKAAPGFVADLPAYAVTSLVSGTAQLYNAGVELANWTGFNAERAQVYDMVNSIGLGQFYAEHKEGIDLTGFIASSFVPGMAGVKALRSSQAALNTALRGGAAPLPVMEKAMGILTPARSRENAINAMKEQVFTSSSVVKLSDQNMIKALAAGAGQQALEFAAFEGAVLATFQNNPMFDGQDAGDFLNHIVMGGLLGGTVGGAIEGARAWGTVKKATRQAHQEAMPWLHKADYTGAETGDRIMLQIKELHSTAVPIPGQFPYLEELAKRKTDDIQASIRNDFVELAGGDASLGESFYHTVMATDDYVTQIGMTAALKRASRVSEVPPEEGVLSKLEAKLLRGQSAKVTQEDIDSFINLNVGYIKNYGSSTAAKLQAERPELLTSADFGKVTIADESITVGDKVYKFKLEDTYDLVGADKREILARYDWARHAKPFTTAVIIGEHDIPLLEKALKEFDDASDAGVKIRTEFEDVPLSSLTYDSFKARLYEAKVDAANKIREAEKKATGVSMKDQEEAVNTLFKQFGVDFNLSVVTDGAMGTRWRIGDLKTVLQNRLDADGLTAQTLEGMSRIDLNRDYVINGALPDIIKTLKHEEGHRIYDTIIASGGLPLDMRDTILKEMERISRKQRADNWKAVDSYRRKKSLTADEQGFLNYMYMEHELAADTYSAFSYYYDEAAKIAPTFAKLYGHTVRKIPQDVYDRAVARSKLLTDDELASVVNVKPELFSEGDRLAEDAVMMARDAYAQELTEKLVSKGLWREKDGLVDISVRPQYTKVVYDKSGLGNELEVGIMERVNLQQQNVDRAIAANLGEDAKYLLTSKEFKPELASSTPVASGLFTASNGNYGSLESMAQFIGNQTTQLINKYKKQTKDALSPAFINLANKPEAAIEYNVLENKLRSIPETYYLDAENMQFKAKKIVQWERAVAELEQKMAEGGTDLSKQMEALQRKFPKVEVETIPIKNKETLEAAAAHIAVNGKRVSDMGVLRTAQGQRYNRDPEAFYPIPVNYKDYKHFAIVIDESITAGYGRHTMIHATSGAELEKLAGLVKKDNPNLTVRTGAEVDKWYKDHGMFEEEKALTDNYLDTEMRRNGMSAPYLAKTDPQKIVNDMLQWHMERESGYVREHILAKYEKQFHELSEMGKIHTNYATSQFSKVRKVFGIEEKIDNPFEDYKKLALAVPKTSDYPIWSNINTYADAAVSRVLNSVSGAFHMARSDKDFTEINSMLQKAGYRGAHYDTNMEMFANAKVPAGYLESFVSKANAIMATVVLRLDHLNAVNNAVSSYVLLGSEAKSIIRAIERQDANALNGIAKVKIPESDRWMLAPHKLVANSLSRYHKMLRGDEDMVALRDFYKERGYITSISTQYHHTLDSITIRGTEDIMDASSRADGVVKSLQKLADKGEKWTGNRLAEEMNRFVAADVAKQLTDVAVSKGVISGREQLAFINTFVNRTQGNYLSSQRPVIFKGAIGQAISLFQTYQFNLMQQLLRHVGEGTAKDAMTLMALQGTIHGMNGLPAFSAINHHIVGTASGNTEHTDLYTKVYGTAGKEMGDWLLYGVGSNFLGLLHPDLKTNLYTRGDINPRQATILPTTINDVPFVAAYGKFINNFIETGQKVAAGGDFGRTVVQGLEHNGISRPLAGLAQTAEAMFDPNMQTYSTTNKGNLIAANDLNALTALVRLAGGKPMDEAVMVDATYRVAAYALADDKKTRLLGEAFKTHMINNTIPEKEVLLNFMDKYMENGGTQEKFATWAKRMYRMANLPQSTKLSEDLNSWEGQYMQKVMGGE